jgi:redox-sensitive bicupin YhaK (pirin superfamily)
LALFLPKQFYEMKKIIHRSASRGYFNHGWLKTHHTFSFGNYMDQERMHFGVLRVINDDIIAPSLGFGSHPHSDMEIITIPLKGSLQHNDNMGNSSVIQSGEIQVMSAGKGVFHSEFNPSSKEEVNLLQIWVFPCQRGVEPRYDQLNYKDLMVKNKFATILQPDPKGQGVWIYANAYFSIGEFDAGQTTEYTVKTDANGLYIFIIEGHVKIGGTNLYSRDGLGICSLEAIEMNMIKDSKILLMDIPRKNN